MTTNIAAEVLFLTHTSQTLSNLHYFTFEPCASIRLSKVTICNSLASSRFVILLNKSSPSSRAREPAAAAQSTQAP